MKESLYKYKFLLLGLTIACLFFVSTSVAQQTQKFISEETVTIPASKTIHTEGVSDTNSGGNTDENGVRNQGIVTYACPTYSLTSTSATSPEVCSNSPALIILKGLPAGNYTVTYDLSVPNAITGQTEFITIDGSGLGTFNTIDLANSGKTTITIKRISSEDEVGCSNPINNNNTVDVTVNAEPTVTFTSAPGDSSCLKTEVTYTTQSGQSDYVWTIPGMQHIDFDITAGGIGSSSNTVTIKWLKPGSKIVDIDYSDANGCAALIPTSNTTLVINPPFVKSQPADKQACPGKPTTFEVEADVPNNVSGYQWEFSADETTWTPVSGATSSTFTISSVALTDYGFYRAVLHGKTPCGSAISNTAALMRSVSASTTWTSEHHTNAWEDDGNWSCGAPTLNTDAVVPVVAPDPHPKIASGVTGQVRNLTIESGGIPANDVIVQGKLQIAGTIVNNSEFNATNGTIEYIGTAPQTINPNTFTNSSANNTVENLVISNNVNLNGPLDLTGTLSFGNVNNKTFATGTKNLTLKSGSAKTARVADLTNSNTNSDNSISGNIWVERYIPQLSQGRRWRLLTVPVASGVSINNAWQEGKTWNDGMAKETSTGYGTLITGGTIQANAATANNNGFDWWTLPTGALGSIRRYVGATLNTGAKWQDLTTTKDNAAFNDAQAYMLYVRGDRSYTTGTATDATILRAAGLLRQGNLSLPLYGTDAQTHTLFGNPYASPLDFYKFYSDAVSNAGKMQNRFWLLNASWGTGVSLGTYELIFSTNGDDLYEGVPAPFSTTSHGVGDAATGLIHSGSGFFVEPTSSADGNVTFKENHKSIGTYDPGVNVFRGMDGSSKPSKLYVNLSMRNNNGEVQLLDGALSRWDLILDDNSSEDNIQKFVNGAENLSFYKGDKNLIIASASSLPKPGDTLYLKIWNTTAGTYLLETKSMNFVHTDLQAFLIDNYLNTQTPISLNNTITAMDIMVTSDAASKDPSRFAIVFKNGLTLPLQLTSLQAFEKVDGVQVRWKTENEVGVKNYELEHSVDAMNFKTLTSLAAKGTAGPQEYGYLDAEPSPVNYYRIKLLGTGGQIKYSETVKIALHNKRGSVSVQPNPVNGTTIGLQLLNKPQGTYTVTLFNRLGQKVMQQIVQHPGGNTIQTISLKQVIGNGLYTLEVRNKEGVKETVKVTVVR